MDNIRTTHFRHAQDKDIYKYYLVASTRRDKNVGHLNMPRRLQRHVNAIVLGISVF